MLIRYFKSAVAFFFLFFLHEFSIGNGQQGISYNGFGLGEVCEALACAVGQIAPNPCYRQ
jgi:hypothetical protein